MEDERARRAIRKIAETLGVPERTFYDRGHAPQDTVLDPTSQDLELLRLFASITDPESRLSCLRYVRRHADIARRGTAEPSGDRPRTARVGMLPSSPARTAPSKG